MYSVPRTGAGFQALGRRDSDQEFQPIRVPDGAMKTAREFHARRRWLGELVSPAPVAYAILEASPSLSEVAIMIERPYLSTESGYIEARRDVHRYPRESGKLDEKAPGTRGEYRAPRSSDRTRAD